MFAQHLSKEWFRSKKHSCQLFSASEQTCNVSLNEQAGQTGSDRLCRFNTWSRLIHPTCWREVTCIAKYEEAVTLRYYFFASIGGSINSLSFSAIDDDRSLTILCVMQPQGDESGHSRDRQTRWAKMSSEPLTRSEVFGQLRRELYGEELTSPSNAHIFIILGASVSSTSEFPLF